MEKPKPNLTSGGKAPKGKQTLVPTPSPQRQIRPAPNFQAQTIQIIHPQQTTAAPLVINNGQIQLPSGTRTTAQSPAAGQRLVFLQPFQGANGQVIYTQSPAASPQQPLQPKLPTTPTSQQVLIRPMQVAKPERPAPRPIAKTTQNVRITPLGPVPKASDHYHVGGAIKEKNEENQQQHPPRFICHCSKSKCLKLYCECFRRGEYCHEACQCQNCQNRDEFQDQRQKAVRIALDRNEDAFKPKVAKSRERESRKGKHLRGCNCKRSGCLKKYCECYQAGVPCHELCNCTGCKNKEDHDPFEAEPKSKKIRIGATRILQSNITAPVISSATACLLAAARGNKGNPEPVLEEFKRLVGTIITHTINSNKKSDSR